MAQERQPEVVKLRQANGALLDAPVYDTGPRRSNYLAVIDIDPTMPGGLAREFAEKGRGDCLYMAEKLILFAAVEFAADYTTYSGVKHRDRWYGVITAKTDDYLLVERCTSGVKAVLRAKEARTSTADRVRALLAEKEMLISRAATISGEIAELSGEASEEPELPAEAPPAPEVGEPELEPVPVNEVYQD